MDEAAMAAWKKSRWHGPLDFSYPLEGWQLFNLHGPGVRRPGQTLWPDRSRGKRRAPMEEWGRGERW